MKDKKAREAIEELAERIGYEVRFHETTSPSVIYSSEGEFRETDRILWLMLEHMNLKVEKRGLKLIKKSKKKND